MRRRSLSSASAGLLALLGLSGCEELTELPQVNPEQYLPSDDAGAPDGALSVPPPVQGDASAPQLSRGIPCDVEAILAAKCQSCHGAPLNSGLMPLLTRADFLAPSVLDPSKTVAQAVRARIHDPQRPMPPLSAGGPLTPAEQAKLDAWIDQGALASSQVCESSGQQPEEEEADLSDCEYLEEFKAHDGTSETDTTGYKAPLVDDHYECFHYEVPWDSEVQAFRFDPVVDDERVVHHWILYSIEENRPAGSHDATCGGKNRTFLAGWAPGQKSAVMPPDVGLLMPKASTHTLQLEVHYNNVARHQDVEDRSGVRICASSKLRKHTAAVHILGSTLIDLKVQPGMQTLVNSCKVASNMGPVTILSSAPHMHQLGRHMKTIIRRANGANETLMDAPFDFRDQTAYPKTTVVNKGDILTTTCTFENTGSQPVKFGEGTGDEMCFNFVTAYPAGGLTGGISPLVSSTANTCIGLGAEPVPILDI